MHFVFESAVPGLLPKEEVMRRLSLWKQAGVSFVAVQIDDGHGATWDSSYVPVDVRSSRSALPAFIDLMHSNGIKVLVVFNVIGLYEPGYSPRPEFLLSGLEPGLNYYNIWNSDFVAWRAAELGECLAKVDADAVSLDFLRSGREAINGEVPADVAVRAAINAFRDVVDCPMLNMTNSLYLTRTQPLQGIDVRSWFSSGLFDEFCFFNYNVPWPDMPWIDHSKVHALGASYNYPTVPAAPLSGRTITNQRGALLRRYPRIKSYGIYTANMMTSEQAWAMAKWNDASVKQWV